MQTPHLDPGTVVDRYTIERMLGQGGMAMVFRVRHNLLGTVHALKVITVNNPEIQRRLLVEGELQRRLRHPNIVAVTDIVEIGGGKALVMEFVDGPSLDKLLSTRRLTLPQADELARGVLAGVAAAHGKGLVHRDLKPANILLQVTDRSFVPKVADFGLAKVLSGGGTSRTRTGSTMGTPHYMSPEQIRDSKNVGPGTDLFALGCILYELVTGRRAFEGDDLLEIFNAIAAGRYTDPRALVPELPDRMHRAIRAALEVKVEDRPASVADLEALWAGDAAGPVSAFDHGALSAARSLGDLPDLEGPLGSSRPDGPSTWAVGETRSDDLTPAPKEPAREAASMDRPAASPPSLSTSRTVVGVLGLGSVLALVAAAMPLTALVAGGAVWVWTADRPEPAPVPVADVAPAVAPAPPPVVAPPTEAPAPAPPVVAAPPPTPVPVPSEAPVVPAVVEQVAAIEPAPEPEPAVAADPVAPAPVIAPPPPAPGEPELTPFLASSDPAERKRGIANLAKRPDDEAVRLLAWELEHETDSSVRQAAFQVVQDRWTNRFGDYDLLQDAVVFMTTQGEVWALPACKAFERNGDDPRKLKRALAHPSTAVRLAAVEAVVASAPRGPDGVDYEALLGPLTSDPSPQVQKRAHQALATLR